MANEKEVTAQATPEAVTTETKQTAEVKAEETKSTLLTTDAETKTTEVKEAEPKAAETVVPESYDLKLPEGSWVDPKRLERIAAVAKEQKLSQEQAQALLNHENEAVNHLVEQHKAQLAQWETDSRGDKEIGGEDGSLLKENIAQANRALKRFGSEKFIQALNESGYGNHPEVIRAFMKIGKAMGEDKLIIAGPTAHGKKPVEDLFYPKQN